MPRPTPSSLSESDAAGNAGSGRVVGEEEGRRVASESGARGRDASAFSGTERAAWADRTSVPSPSPSSSLSLSVAVALAVAVAVRARFDDRAGDTDGVTGLWARLRLDLFGDGAVGGAGAGTDP